MPHQYQSSSTELDRYISIVRLPDRLSRRKGKELIDALSDSSRRVRAMAALKLGTSRCSDAVEPLISMLHNEEDAETRGMAALALGEIGDRRATGPLLRALEAAQTNEERRLILYSLQDVADPSATTSILPLLDDPDVETRIAAAAVLVVLGNENALPVLADLEKDRELAECCKSYVSALKGKLLKRIQQAHE